MGLGVEVEEFLDGRTQVAVGAALRVQVRLTLLRRQVGRLLEQCFEGFRGWLGHVLPDVERGLLRVQVHPMSNPRSNRAIAHLLEHLNAAEFTYPGTNLRLAYSIAGEADTLNSDLYQNPTDQDV